jgi:tRNA-binding protein
MITWNDFEKIDMRVGTIIDVAPFPKAKNPSWQLVVDFGDLGFKSSSAQITSLYSSDELLGKQVIAIVNFPAKQIANFFSECLVMGVYNENNEVVLLQPDKKIKNGSKVG